MTGHLMRYSRKYLHLLGLKHSFAMVQASTCLVITAGALPAVQDNIYPRHFQGSAHALNSLLSQEYVPLQLRLSSLFCAELVIQITVLIAFSQNDHSSSFLRTLPLPRQELQSVSSPCTWETLVHLTMKDSRRGAV